jgi:hypothetical protein
MMGRTNDAGQNEDCSLRRERLKKGLNYSERELKEDPPQPK